MNYRIVEKLVSARVASGLQTHVLQSNGTVLFLKLISYVTSAFTEFDLTALQRVFRIWYAVYFVRFWKDWLIQNKLSVEDNFITLNAAFCIELNAHELIKVIIYCRRNNCSDAFLPPVFNSQWNERFFRKLRSMSSTYSTIVNFSVLQSLYRVKRADFLLESETILKNGTRKHAQSGNQLSSEMPDDDSITDMIECAMYNAMTDLNSLGIQCSEHVGCLVQPVDLAMRNEIERQSCTKNTSENDNTDFKEHHDDITGDDIVDLVDLFDVPDFELQLTDYTAEYGNYSSFFNSVRSLYIFIF